MFHTIKRILDIAGDQKKYIYAGIVCNILKTFSMAMMLMAVYVVISRLDSLTAEVIGQGLGILIASVFGRFLFQWLEDISMSAKGFDIFRDYRLAIGEKMKSAPMGYFSDQRLGTIQTTLTSTVVELEQYSMLFITDITGGVSMSVIIIVMMLFSAPGSPCYPWRACWWASMCWEWCRKPRRSTPQRCRRRRRSWSPSRWSTSGASRCCALSPRR